MKVTKCVIPIAGKGTRRLPITKTISKEMFPILNEPTILLQVKECLKSGIEGYICDVFTLKDDVIDLINKLFEIGVTNINLLFDSNPLLLNKNSYEIDNYIEKFCK